MITKLLLAPLVGLANWLNATLPAGHTLTGEGLDQAKASMRGLNALLPVSDVLVMASGVLSLAGVWIVVRLALVVRHTVFP